MKINSKFLDEARKIDTSKWFESVPAHDNWDRNCCAVLLESVRLKNEYQSEEEYQAYLDDFNKRMDAAIQNCKRKVKP